MNLLGATELSPKEAGAIARALTHIGSHHPYIAYPRSVSIHFDGGDQILVEATGVAGPTRWLLRRCGPTDEYDAFIAALIRRELKSAAAGNC